MSVRIAQVSLPEEVAAWLDNQGRSRDAIGRAVAANLPELVAGLRALGFSGAPRGARKPRRVDPKTWTDLQEAARAVGLTSHDLLTLCVQRAFAASETGHECSSQDAPEDREEEASGGGIGL